MFKRAVAVALLAFATLGSAVRADPVVIADDGPNGPVGVCVLPLGHWELSFTRVYAARVSADGASTVDVNLLYGDLLLDIACDGAVRVLEIEPTTVIDNTLRYVFPRQPDVPFGYPYPPVSLAAKVEPIAYLGARASRDATDANPVIDLEIAIGGAPAQHWRLHVTELSKHGGHWLIGRDPWTADSLAATPDGASIDPALAGRGEYRRFSTDELYAISRGDPFPATPDGRAGAPRPTDPPGVTEGAMDEFWLIPVRQRVPLILGITTPEGEPPSAGRLPARGHYLASVDWNGRPPGEVTYYMFQPSGKGGTRKGTAELTPEGYAVAVDLDGRAPGEHQVVFTALAGDSQSVERKSIAIVVPP